MGIRTIEEKKYTVQLYYITWHACCESVREGQNQLSYSDMDGDHCYFNRFFEYLQAGWDILKMEDQLSVVLTGDVFPIEKHNVEKGVRRALARYIHQYPEWGGYIGVTVEKPDRPRLPGERIVDYPYIIDSKKVDKIVEEVLESLKNKPIEDFVINLEDVVGENK
ncbi:hypothetical protein A2Z67_04065 [Candidatus Woesebacteria bacterium RBG_13_36_22]|uniref:Uncharacterized protein n=1 Tax=Candidatus Woesebacteria bacterium RBG_13_36_22 TaxID=1802478 RepID=A0A1F7X610_9BACT|nr:MAG: hypothetical protein A2Z67_04065 [Candidatus Woesebacteria bacterium RBG_13_36_22]